MQRSTSSSSIETAPTVADVDSLELLELLELAPLVPLLYLPFPDSLLDSFSALLFHIDRITQTNVQSQRDGNSTRRRVWLCLG